MSINKLEIELAQSKAKLAKLEQELEKLNNDAFSIYQVHRTTEISRRDYFAAMAMQSYISKYGDKIDIIEDSIFIADKIIAQLDKPKKT